MLKLLRLTPFEKNFQTDFFLKYLNRGFLKLHDAQGRIKKSVLNGMSYFFHYQHNTFYNPAKSFTPDALPATILSIYPGLGPASGNIEMCPQCLGLQVKEDMGKVDAREKDIENKTLWRKIICCGYP